MMENNDVCAVLVVLFVLFGFSLIAVVHTFKNLNEHLEKEIRKAHNEIDSLDKRLKTEIRSLQNELTSTKNMLERTQHHLESEIALQENATAQLQKRLKDHSTKIQDLNEKTVVMNKSFTNWTKNQLQSITIEFDKKIRLLQEGLKLEHATVTNLKNETDGRTNNITRELKSMNVEFDKKIILFGEKLQKEHATVVNLKNEMVETTSNIMQETRDQLLSVSLKLDNNIDFVHYQLETETALVTQSFKTEIGNFKTDLLNWELKQKVYFSAKIIYKAVLQEDVVFADVITNIGNAYNNVTGKFTAPYSGVYAFFSNIIAMEITKHCQIALEINDKPRLYFTVSTDPQRGGANMLITHLDQGDRVSIYNNGCYVGFPRDAPEAHWNTFSGFLLHSEDSMVPVLYELSRISREDMVNVCTTK